MQTANANQQGNQAGTPEIGNSSLAMLIERLKVIQDGDPIAELRAYREKVDAAFLPFAESELQFVDRNNLDEAGAHIIALHEDAVTLRKECDTLLRSSALKDSDISASMPSIKEGFRDCCARLENICVLRQPDLLESLDAVL